VGLLILVFLPPAYIRKKLIISSILNTLEINYTNVFFIYIYKVIFVYCLLLNITSDIRITIIKNSTTYCTLIEYSKRERFRYVRYVIIMFYFFVSRIFRRNIKRLKIWPTCPERVSSAPFRQLINRVVTCKHV